MKIPYVKMSGAGNDFIVVDNRNGALASLDLLARKVCDRQASYGGADGFIAIEGSERGSFEMKYFNADGSSAMMCGNGGRCAARFAVMEGITANPEFSFAAVGSLYRAVVDGDRVRLTMPNPKETELRFTLALHSCAMQCSYINVETPHAVIFFSDIIPQPVAALEAMNINGIGKEIRLHERFAPLGANANFAEVLPDNTVRLRTYERGVENETLACGTGAVATAIAAHFLYAIVPPVKILTKSTETLTVDFTDSNGSIENLSLEGSANVLGEGEIEV